MSVINDNTSILWTQQKDKEKHIFQNGRVFQNWSVFKYMAAGYSVDSSTSAHVSYVYNLLLSTGQTYMLLHFLHYVFSKTKFFLFEHYV